MLLELNNGIAHVRKLNRLGTHVEVIRRRLQREDMLF